MHPSNDLAQSANPRELNSIDASEASEASEPAVEPTPIGKARDTSVRGKIKASVRHSLWARSAGRCTLCNNRVLDGAPPHWHSIAAAEMAHIIGAKATTGSPRGLADKCVADLEDEENLILCCHVCHRTIDDADHVDYFTAAKLRQLKKDHEDRIELATAHGVLTRTAVIRLGCDVRGSHSVASRREVTEALFASGYLGLVVSQRSGHFDCSLAGEATDQGYWLMVRAQIEKTMSHIAQGVETGEVDHVSVFAIAPIPALVLLGASLDDKVETRLWQKHRDAGWVWSTPPSSPPVNFTFDTSAKSEVDRDAREVALVCSLSAEVNPDRIPTDLHEVPRATLRPVRTDPTPTLLGNEESLRNFKLAFRGMLAAVEKAFPNAERWHLIAAAPVTACIEAGRSFMREVQPPVDVYQRTTDGTYTAVLTVNDTGRDAAALQLSGAIA